MSKVVSLDSLKTAYIRPLIKKPGLDVKTLSNYRPVSYLKFIGKTIKRIVASRLNTVISDSGLADKFQSAYRCKHSTESALLRVQNDIVCAMDNGYVTALILLDLIAAFDTVDHTIFCPSLKMIFRVYITTAGSFMLLPKCTICPHMGLSSWTKETS